MYISCELHYMYVHMYLYFAPFIMSQIQKEFCTTEIAEVKQKTLNKEKFEKNRRNNKKYYYTN